jgi:hypothetical protein
MNLKTWSLLALLPLAGCVAMPQYIPLEPRNEAAIKDMRLVSAIYQDEIYLSAASPGVVAAAGGGLIAAMIESQIAKGRQDEIQATLNPFYASIDDVDFRKVYWAAVLPEFQKLHGAKITETKTTAAIIPYLERGKMSTTLAAGKGLLYLQTRYSFTPDLAALEVVTSADLWVGGQAELAFSNVFTYQSAAIGRTGRDAIALWGRDGGERYRALLDEGIAETVRMIRLDAAHPRIKGLDQKLPGSDRSIEVRKAGPRGPAVTGPLLAEKPARVVVRNTDGRMFSLPRRTQAGR